VVANERLTGAAGGLLLALFVVEVVTVPTLRSLLSVHFFAGVLLVGPLAVKLGSTGWRFVRYYTGNLSYRRRGRPRLLLRVLAPFLILSTLVLIGSGIALAATGPAPQILIVLHVASFFVWLVTIVIHLLVHLPAVPSLVADDWREEPSDAVAGLPSAPAAPHRGLRLALNVAAMVAGAIAALFVLPTMTPWVSWLPQRVTPLQLVLGGGGILALGCTILAASQQIRSHRVAGARRGL
jgi:hypothetical protein